MDVVCIFQSDDVAEVERVKKILENNSIQTMIKNLYTQNLFGGLKPFSGHDPIAGSIQVFVREDELEKGIEILTKEEGEIGSSELEENISEEEIIHEKLDEEKDSKQKYEDRRLIYISLMMSVFSFLIIPFLINIPLIINLLRTRTKIAYMLIPISLISVSLGLFTYLLK